MRAMAVQPDSRDHDRYLAESGWADELLAMVGTYEIVQHPARRSVWYLIDTRRPRTRDNRYRVEWQNHAGWVVDSEQPGVCFYGHDQMLLAIRSWVTLHP